MKHSAKAASNSALIGLLNAPVKFGIIDQGKFGTVGKMLADGESWERIAAVVGWEPKTLKRHWLMIMDHVFSGDPERSRSLCPASVDAGQEDDSEAFYGGKDTEGPQP